MTQNKPSKQDIITASVAAIAVIMAIVVVLLKTGILDKNEQATEPETEIKTEIVLVSETKEDGEVIYYTMLNTYVKPKISSNHIYPTTKPVSTTEPETQIFYEHESCVALCDENGNPLYDENGEPLTKIITYTVPVSQEDETTSEETTAEFVPKTSSIAVTNKLHIQKRDSNGNPLTEIVTLEAKPMDIEKDDKQEETGTFMVSTTKSAEFSRDDTAANEIISIINQARQAKGLDSITVDSTLTAAARNNSMALAKPEQYSKETGYQKMYTKTSQSGGTSLASSVGTIYAITGASDAVSKIGVSVIKYNEQYYLTVIFQ